LASGSVALKTGCTHDVSGPVASGVPTVPLTWESEPGQALVAPADAKVLTTACDYCIVGCGYKAVMWPVESGASCAEPSDGRGESLSENAHNIVLRDGVPHHVVVRADMDTDVVNPGGEFGGGGQLAKKLYNPESGTADRLQRPTLRVGDRRVEISWEDAIALAGDVIAASREDHGELAFAMRSYSYNYYENTYAITKLMFHEDALHSPCWAPHDKVAHANDAPGLSDAGVDAFSASYDDWSKAEAIYVSGVSLAEARPVLFQSWIKGGPKLVVVNPRRDATAAYAERYGGIHLQLRPGTDPILNNAIARVIVENGWHDSEFIAQHVADDDDIASEADSKWRRKRFARSFEDYKSSLLSEPLYKAEAAAAVCGVPASSIREAAMLLAAPTDGVAPKTSFMLEKGNYWSWNYENSASLVSLGLLCGAGTREGRVISRGGGHQRGMLRAAGYPHEKIPDDLPKFDGHKLPFNIDEHVASGRARATWIIGTTWFGASPGSRWLRDKVRARTVRSPEQLTDAEVSSNGVVDVEAALGVFRARMERGDLVLMQSDIYDNAVSELADLVFPASGWGEHDFTRMQGERRLRLYERIADAPGEAKPDWWIVARVAQRMGLPGFDWADGNEIFEEAAEVSRGRGVHDYGDLVVAARAEGITGHEYLRRLGTRGVQCPVKLEPEGMLAETKRVHADGVFKTASGRACLVLGDWRSVEPRWLDAVPSGDELWLTNMRTNAWQSLYDDARNENKRRAMPDLVVQVSPDDATARGIASGDEVRLFRDDVLTPVGSTTSAEVFGMAHVTTDVPPGVMCGYFNFRGQTAKAINALTSTDRDPVNNLVAVKIGRARIEPTGRRSVHADSFSFIPRSLFGGA
jgi:arsenite oxidase large subunit